MPTIAVEAAVQTAPDTSLRSVAGSGLPLERRIGGAHGESAGPLLLCVAALHGNEPAGVEGLRRVLSRLAAPGVVERLRGDLVGLVGNLGALAAGRRFLQEDLNRIWGEERLARVRAVAAAGGGELTAEEAELAGLDRTLSEVIAAARGTVYLLDLHTTSGDGAPFGLLEDTLVNRRLAQRLPVPLVLGVEEELHGTLSHHLAARGVVTAGFEAGQHDDPASADRAEAAVWVALEAAGLLAGPRWGEVERARRLLAAAGRRVPPVVELRYRHPITPDDGFEMAPGFHNFQPVGKGQTLARDRRGPVTAPESALLLMPLYQALGEDGFFLVRRVRPLWLRVSAVARRLGLARGLHLLPGVRRHPQLAGSFLVDRRVARWAALELFHLLGFHRRGPAGRYLVMSRRRER